ncbi:MAG: imidazole glycerol phosphate synthase subunit HisH [Paenibacillaceae bacterium]
MNVVVIDYGMGNLGSVRRALEECGARVMVSDHPEDLRTASHIILPGVGAFTDGMANLNSQNWAAEINRAVVEGSVPMLGICLGMQLLAEVGFEGGRTAGLGLIPGVVDLLKVENAAERVPHVGWNEIILKGKPNLFDQIANHTDFYFVHSYHFQPTDSSHITTTTPYCGGFTSSVQNGNVYGVQFHPEKSQRAGFQLLKNFLKL